MKRLFSNYKSRKPDPGPSDARSIDLLYGLEPVIEPGTSVDASGASNGLQFHLIQCPYCGESFESQLDVSGGSACYVEDCQVCCRPIEFNVEVDSAGVLVALTTLRSD
jgi:hypothetical protein